MLFFSWVVHGGLWLVKAQWNAKTMIAKVKTHSAFGQKGPPVIWKTLPVWNHGDKVGDDITNVGSFMGCLRWTRSWIENCGVFFGGKPTFYSKGCWEFHHPTPKIQCLGSKNSSTFLLHWADKHQHPQTVSAAWIGSHFIICPWKEVLKESNKSLSSYIVLPPAEKEKLKTHLVQESNGLTLCITIHHPSPVAPVSISSHHLLVPLMTLIVKNHWYSKITK